MCNPYQRPLNRWQWFGISQILTRVSTLMDRCAFNRPGVLWFFRDPNAAEFHPLKMMLELPVFQYVRRLVLINIMYGFIIIMMVWLPAKSIFVLLPGLLPYKMLLSHPIEFLALNLGLPLLQNEINLSAQATHMSRAWMAGASWIFGVTEYMMPPEQVNSFCYTFFQTKAQFNSCSRVR